MTVHSPGKMVRAANKTWHVICVCGDPFCAEDWDYEAIYVLQVPPGVKREDLPLLPKEKVDDGD